MMEDLIKDLKENFNHYLVLAVILNIGLAAFWYFRFVSSIQLLIVAITGIAYLVWGIVHHSLAGDLHLRVVLEYLSTVVFGFLVIWFLLLRA